jgi:hypothetical protein
MQQQIVLEPDSTTPAGAAAAAAAAGGTAGSGDASNLPLEIQRGLMRAGIPIIGSAAAVRAMAEGLGQGDLFQGAAGPSAAAAAEAAAAAVMPAKQVLPSAARKRVLDRAVKQWLTTYNGDLLAGWQIRPKVNRHGYGCYGRAGWSVSGWVRGGVPQRVHAAKGSTSGSQSVSQQWLIIVTGGNGWL